MSKKSYAERNLKFETLQLHVGQENPDPVTDARAVPIYATSSYVFRNSEHAAARFGLTDAGNIYGRLTNPTEDVFEQRVAALEGGVAALAVASGAAAISYTIQNLAQAGDHIVAAKNIYGGTYNLLAHTLVQYGIETTFVDPFNFDEVEAAIKDNTKAIFIETLGNPNSDVVDIEKLADIAHAHKIPLAIDNTFATPYLVRPIEYGADIVVHSATKFIGGHGAAIGGVIVDSGKFDWEASGKFASLTEPNPSYHGISFTKVVGPAAFVTKIRAILLRDTGGRYEIDQHVPHDELLERNQPQRIQRNFDRNQQAQQNLVDKRGDDRLIKCLQPRTEKIIGQRSQPQRNQHQVVLGQ